MKRSKKDARRGGNPEDPRPLNFDRDEELGPSDHLAKPFTTPSDRRGDNEDNQYYEEEETLSPEEIKQRKQEGTI